MVRIAFRYILLLLRVLPALARTQSEQALIELALRQQLAVYRTKRPRPRLSPLDRAFWGVLSQCWPRWRSCLHLVQPETVVRWHRRGFRFYWRWISARGPGRPRVSPELRHLIRRLALENGRGARKVHGELGKLGFRVSLATVARYMPKRRRDPGRRQSWATFLRLLREYVDYYNEERVHTELGDSPEGRAVREKPSSSSRLFAHPRVGGLHHRYEWSEAA